MTFYRKKKIVTLFIFFVICFPQMCFSYITDFHPVSISAQVGPYTPPNGGGGGGGGGGGSSITLPTTVNFSGMAYPSSKVTILVDGKIAVSTVADPAARFSVSVNNLKTDTYNFSVFGTDIHGMKSLTFSFPVYVTEGTTVNISGIFLSPTINIDKSEVRKGDSLLVYGQTVPDTNVNVIFHSNTEITRKTKTDKTGLYKYSMDTSPLEYGDHNVKSKTLIDEEVGGISAEVPFIVGLVSKKKEDLNNCSLLRADLNCDQRVNLVDFSIMAYWYKKLSPPSKVDLNSDGKITLMDFSIMAFNWTG